MKRLIKQSSLKKIGEYIYLDKFILKSGDIIGLSCRIVNNSPWFQIFQQGMCNTSSFYDGPDRDRAFRIYGDILMTFRNINASENFINSSKIYDKKIEKLMMSVQRNNNNFQKLKNNPLFLGIPNSEDF